MTDPELRRVEPTGNPRVDALIDGLVCPSCRTIYNAAKAGCADLWHHDNQPPIATGGVVTWADVAELATASMREQEARRSALADREAAVSLDDVTMRYTKEDLDEAHKRGVAEGRRQATEGWDREWSVDYGNNGRWYEPFESEAAAIARKAGVPSGTVVSRLVGPWEATEQPAGERDIESYCHRCRGPNTPWSAPSPLWNEVMRGGSIVNQDEFDGIVCPTCFALLAEERGIAQLWWLSAQRVHVELETVTPSGRTYDETTQRWRDTEQAGGGQ